MTLTQWLSVHPLARTKAISSPHFSHGMSTFQCGLPQPSFPFSPWLPRGVLRSLHPFQSRNMFNREPPRAQPGQPHPWKSLTYCTRSFNVFLPMWNNTLWVLAINTDIFPKCYWCRASVKHPVGSLIYLEMHHSWGLYDITNYVYFSFLIYLLIMLLQLSHFHPFTQLHPATPSLPHSAPIVHVHGSYL